MTASSPPLSAERALCWRKRRRKRGDYTEEYGGPYIVNQFEHTCTCPSYLKHAQANPKQIGYCKHLWALELWLAWYPLAETPEEN